ncbi:unnamed protein product [Protopolystoma xenopodis]|uniref:Uncharacterized protein n=1 Tax=Protopolystoma xenopodis TaxID=117903 RepID=A0A3S5AUF5_9PLAT|nr:unnamed protein product [Protopolystoma xenopodis]
MSDHSQQMQTTTTTAATHTAGCLIQLPDGRFVMQAPAGPAAASGLSTAGPMFLQAQQTQVILCFITLYLD